VASHFGRELWPTNFGQPAEFIRWNTIKKWLMDESVITDPAILNPLHELARDSYDLEALVADFTSSTHVKAGASYSPDDLLAIAAKYATVMSHLDRTLRQSESLLAAVEAITPTTPAPLPVHVPPPVPAPPPPPPVLHRPFVLAPRMFDSFIGRQLPIVASPYPPLCGSIPLPPTMTLPLGAFVAARLSDDWTLCYVAAEDAGGYLVCDADSDSEAPTLFPFRASAVLPLPTSLPDRKGRGCEFDRGARVLALWPEGRIWTSVFYPATISKAPSETAHSYTLDFDGWTKPMKIPPGYVIASGLIP
jgi:hypothetical protein